MFTGVVCGLIAATMQSVSYVFSRMFISRHASAFQLSVCSQVLMGVLGFILVGISLLFVSYPRDLTYYLLGFAWLTTYIMAQSSFFLALKSVEASRLSSLLGLKIIALALIAVLFGSTLSAGRWAAVVLCTVSAVGMNFSGGKLKLESCLWIGMAVLSYALCDLSCTKMMNMMPGANMIHNSFAVVGVSYALLGVVSLPLLYFVPRKRELLRDALPFSLTWFVSMIFLLTAFGSLGVVYGTILQSGRGIASVVIGIILLKLGFENLEPRLGKKAWIRRMIMAVLMLCAMTLYARG